jgi:hypothetical protein
MIRIKASIAVQIHSFASYFQTRMLTRKKTQYMILTVLAILEPGKSISTFSSSSEKDEDIHSEFHFILHTFLRNFLFQNERISSRSNSERFDASWTLIFITENSEDMF